MNRDQPINSALLLPNGARFFRCALQVNPYEYLVGNNKKTNLDRRRLRDYFERLRSQQTPADQSSLEWRQRIEDEARRMTPERMRAGCRSARNELLKDVMRDYGYLEHMGMGVPRKIVRGMRELNGTEPDLIEDGERFTVRLWKDGPVK